MRAEKCPHPNPLGRRKGKQEVLTRTLSGEGKESQLPHYETANVSAGSGIEALMCLPTASATRRTSVIISANWAKVSDW